MVILFDQENLPEDVLELVFATDQQVIVGKELIKLLKSKGGEVNKTEMSFLANALHDGNYECEIDKPEYRGKKVKLSYNKRQFYDRILTPMRGMGLIDFDIYRKVYKISDKFNKNLVRIGLMWLRELGK
jgi:hypothetical protein